MDSILEWFEGKSFTKEFWKNLVSEKLVTLSDDSLKIQDSTFESYLHYESAQLELAVHFKGISDNVDKEEFAIYRTSLLGSDLDLLSKAFKNELKKDSINFEFSQTPNPVKFSFARRNYIFGSIPTTRHSETSLMAFVENKTFKENLDKILMDMPVPEPPAPPKSTAENEDDDDWFPKDEENQELFK